MGYMAYGAIFIISMISLAGLLLFISEDKKNKFIERVNKI